MSKIRFFDLFLPFSDINKTSASLIISKWAPTHILHSALSSPLTVERESKLHESYDDNVAYLLEVSGTTLGLILETIEKQMKRWLIVIFALKESKQLDSIYVSVFHFCL